MPWLCGWNSLCIVDELTPLSCLLGHGFSIAEEPVEAIDYAVV